MFCATVWVAVMFGRTCVVADQWAPQSLDDHQLTPLTWIGTTTRPQTVPGAAPGGGGWTSGTPPMPPVRPDCGAAELAVAAPSTGGFASAGVNVTPVPAAPAVPTLVTSTVSWLPPLGSTSTFIDVFTCAPLAWAEASGEVSVTPVPVAPAVPTEETVSVSRPAPVSTFTVWPARVTAAPLGCAEASADPSVRPVPVAPAVPTEETVRLSPSTFSVWPGFRFWTLTTLIVESPAAAAAASVVATNGATL